MDRDGQDRESIKASSSSWLFLHPDNLCPSLLISSSLQPEPLLKAADASPVRG
jgi:hypothetical protein